MQTYQKVMHSLVTGLLAVSAAIFTLNTFVSGRWQFLAGALCFAWVAVAWELLRRHWTVDGTYRVRFDHKTMLLCGSCVGAFVGAAMVLAWLG